MKPMPAHKTSDDVAYWQSRYEAGQTGWDLGAANRVLVDYVVDNCPSTARVLIPGAGRAHEAIELWQRGYSEVYVLDWADRAFDELRSSSRNLPVDRMLVDDFFEHQGSYDVILEQTFFCAIPPARRSDYVAKLPTLLAPHGVWVGVLFDTEFSTPGPPFGGSVTDYRALFQTAFTNVAITPNTRSVAPRSGREVVGICHNS